MSYKPLARAYFTAVSRYDVATIERMVDPDYIQHNPRVPTGRAAFLAMIPKLRAHGSRILNRRILEDGRHVVMHHQWLNAAPFGHDRAVAFHVLRFDDQGRIAEHWNVMMRDASPGGPGSSLADGHAEITDREKTEENKARTSALFRDRKQHRVFGEGNFTLSVTEGVVSGVASAIYDLLRFEDGRVVDHWRISQEIPSTGLANDNTMFGF